MTDTIADRVARGAALLDEKRPGWDARIDLAVLDLEDCRNCIVGQLFGARYEMDSKSFKAGLRLLGFDEYTFASNEDHGFDVDGEDWDMPFAEEYAALTAEWRRVIAARRLAMRPAQETAAAPVSERIDRLTALTGTEQAMALFYLNVIQPAAVDAALDFLDDMLLDAVKRAVLPQETAAAR